MSFTATLDAIEKPRIIEIESGLFAIVFDLLKIVVARFILRAAAIEGALRDRTHIFETTSGSMGLALALACRERNLQLTIVGDYAIDPVLRARIESLGALVSIVSEAAPVGGLQQSRLTRLRDLMSAARDPFWTRQYHNPAARAAYHDIAKDVCTVTGALGALVAAVGSGASACGLIEGLRGQGEVTRLVAVDTHGSILFGQEDKPRILRGMGNSILPDNLRHEVVDECHWVTPNEAYAATRDLFGHYGIDAGPSSGAAFLVARWAARRADRAIAFVCADGGERYRHQVFGAGQKGVAIPIGPTVVESPRHCKAEWSYMAWNRRPLADVVGKSD
jgi:S-sulfo-L-cysteine synthase (3-phospho-L-serine-dependent)